MVFPITLKSLRWSIGIFPVLISCTPCHPTLGLKDGVSIQYVVVNPIDVTSGIWMVCKVPIQ